MTDEEAVHWSQPYETLLPSETVRLDDWLALYRDMVALHALDPENPLAIEMVLARVMTASLWKILRETGDADAVLKQVAGRSNYREARRNAFIESDERQRIKALEIAGIVQMQELLEQFRAGVVGQKANLKMIKGGKR